MAESVLDVVAEDPQVQHVADQVQDPAVHKYVTLVYDLKTATVEYVNPGRDYASLGAYFKAFSQQQLAGIQGIALDMCQAYINACNHFVPQADQKMVFDRFHIMRHMLEAVDAVRKRENRDLQREGDTRLAKSKYLWLYSRENVPAKSMDRFKNFFALVMCYWLYNRSMDSTALCSTCASCPSLLPAV